MRIPGEGDHDSKPKAISFARRIGMVIGMSLE